MIRTSQNGTAVWRAYPLGLCITIAWSNKEHGEFHYSSVRRQQTDDWTYKPRSTYPKTHGSSSISYEGSLRRVHGSWEHSPSSTTRVSRAWQLGVIQVTFLTCSVVMASAISLASIKSCSVTLSSLFATVGEFSSLIFSNFGSPRTTQAPAQIL